MLIQKLLLVGKNAMDGGDYHIAVPYFQQENSEWCWAATAQSVIVAKTQGVLNPKQCTLANIAFNRSDCCTQPTPAACIKGYSEFHGLLFQVAGINCVHKERPLAFEEIRGLVIYAIIFATSGEWYDGQTHSGIISGKRVKNGKQQVYFLDPDKEFFDKLGAPAEGWVDYTWVLNGYNPPCKGNWLESWTDI